MHRENVKRKMMKTENKQICYEDKCKGCNPTSVEVGCIYVMQYVKIVLTVLFASINWL